jgi:hypothetical protein
MNVATSGCAETGQDRRYSRALEIDCGGSAFIHKLTCIADQGVAIGALITVFLKPQAAQGSPT